MVLNISDMDEERALLWVKPYSIPLCQRDTGETKHKGKVLGPHSAKSNKRWDQYIGIVSNTCKVLSYRTIILGPSTLAASTSNL